MCWGVRVKTGDRWTHGTAFCKWLRKTSETTTNVKPEAPAMADKRQKQTSWHCPLMFTQKLSQVWGTAVQLYEEHTRSPSTVLTFLPHFHSRKPSMLTELSTWKTISGEFKIHSCSLPTRTLSSWKEIISIAQIKKQGGWEKRWITITLHSQVIVKTRITQEMWKPRA